MSRINGLQQLNGNGRSIFFLRVSKRAMKQMSRIDGLQQLDGNERSNFFFLSSLREG